MPGACTNLESSAKANARSGRVIWTRKDTCPTIALYSSWTAGSTIVGQSRLRSRKPGSMGVLTGFAFCMP
eukprot:1831699-Rhodomonas_salina.1